jgi:hypothetical protein
VSVAWTAFNGGERKRHASGKKRFEKRTDSRMAGLLPAIADTCSRVRQVNLDLLPVEVAARCGI